MKTTQCLSILALCVAFAAPEAAADTETIEQVIPFGIPGDDPLEYFFQPGLSSALPGETSETTFGPWEQGGCGGPNFDDCSATRIAPFDDSLGELTAVSLSFTLSDSETYGEVSLEGIINPGVPHMFDVQVTHSDFRWLIDSLVDADEFSIDGNPTFIQGFGCMGNPGDGDDCGAQFDSGVLEFGFGFGLFQRWEPGHPQWFGPDGIEEHFRSSSADEVFVSVTLSSMMDAPNLTNISFASIEYDGVYFDSDAMTLVVTYEYTPSSPDSDGDGIPDATDNCTIAANPDQTDTNGDGFGNACDPDVNNDGIVNFVDLGVLRTVFFNNGVTDTDFNTDGVTNFVDLGIMRSFFFAAPGPAAGAP